MLAGFMLQPCEGYWRVREGAVPLFCTLPRVWAGEHSVEMQWIETLQDEIPRI